MLRRTSRFDRGLLVGATVLGALALGAALAAFPGIRPGTVATRLPTPGPVAARTPSPVGAAMTPGQKLSPSVSAPPSPGSSANPATPGAQPSAAAGGCDPAALTLTVTTDRSGYAPAHNVHVTAVITNGGSVTCGIQEGCATPVAEIDGSTGPAWYSNPSWRPECQAIATVTLSPGQAEHHSWDWDGYYCNSESACPGAVAAAGRYSVHVTWNAGGGGMTGTAAFSISAS
ncbi:MAG: hypothetical protein ACYDAY_09995 [Candidatus Dormibacteria bacterium]